MTALGRPVPEQGPGLDVELGHGRLGGPLAAADPGFLDRYALAAVYQPVVCDGAVIGFEALLRGSRGGADVNPGQLFALATALGLLPELDRRAAALAVAGAGRWLGDRSLFVNLAPSTPEDAQRWTDQLLAAALAEGLRPGQVVVEVNEEQSLDDPAVVAVLHSARRRGLALALDDVDGGPVSLLAADVLRPDWVKLDGSLVRGLEQPSGAAQVRSVLETAQIVGARVIAEQVETTDQADALASLGVRCLQGWLTGRPAPAA